MSTDLFPGNAHKESIVFSKDRYRLTYEPENNTISLFNRNGDEFFKFPAEFKLVTESGDIYLKQPGFSVQGDTLILQGRPHECIESMRLFFYFHPDCIVIGYEATVAPKKEIKVSSAVYFLNGKNGLHMNDCLKAFSPTPVQEGFYGKFQPQCSTFSTFCPPPLNFSIGNLHGLVSFGLVDLPDSIVFGMTREMGILAEEPCFRKVIHAGDIYYAPRLLVTFPEDEWEGLSLFREKLMALDFYQPRSSPKVIPGWWKKPLVCTYGDQIMEIHYNQFETDDWDDPRFNTNWFENWLEEAERRLGLTDFTIILDVFWQYRFSADPSPDPSRFPDLRHIIDKCHKRGHHVLLWYAPFIDKLDLGFEPASKRFGIVSDTQTGFDNTFMLDFTHPNAQAYLAYLAKRLFGSEEGELNADGLKMDFLCFIRNPKDATYSSADKGMGIKEQFLFYQTFMSEATRVKKDVLLDASVCDPRFEEIVSMNRLHDIHYFWWERELRARISSLAAPGILIDSDGAIMTSDWVEQSYIDAVLYGTPSLYYVRKFHDGIRPSDEKMNSLGKLFSLSSLKPDGKPVFKSFGNWQLVNNQKIMGETINGRTILIFDGKGNGYLFTWDNEFKSIPHYGRVVMKVEPPVDDFQTNPESISGNWKPGIVYHLTIAENADE